MAGNTLPQGLDDLFTFAEEMANGLHAHGEEIGVKQNDEAAIREVLTAAETAQATYQAARSGKHGLSTTQTVAGSNSKAFIAATRGVLANYLGGTWSEVWQATGFPHQSTAVPSRTSERLALLQALHAYFTAHPEHENAPLNVTAARADELFTALSGALGEVNLGITDARQKKTARDAAETALRARKRGLIDELGQLFPGDDPR